MVGQKQTSLGFRLPATTLAMAAAAVVVYVIPDIGPFLVYDRAAIKFGYGQLVEAFINPPGSHPMLQAYYLDTLIHDYSHYTDLPKIFEITLHNGLDPRMR